MATIEAEAPIVIPARRETVATRVARGAAKTPVHIFLVFVGLLWLMPTIGLFFTSLLSPADFQTNGWWKVIAHPHLATWRNYSEVWNNTDIPHALWITAQIAIGGTGLPILIAALAGYAFAWFDFPGRDWLFIL